MTTKGYTRQRCGVCCQPQNFKLLPQERDEHGRTLMVCTQCNSHRAAPGQRQQSQHNNPASLAGRSRTDGAP